MEDSKRFNKCVKQLFKKLIITEKEPELKILFSAFKFLKEMGQNHPIRYFSKYIQPYKPMIEQKNDEFLNVYLENPGSVTISMIPKERVIAKWEECDINLKTFLWDQLAILCDICNNAQSCKQGL